MVPVRTLILALPVTSAMSFSMPVSWAWSYGWAMGKVLYWVAALPPSASAFSTRITGYPPLAADRAAFKPVQPPPMTRMVLTVSAISGSGAFILASFITPILR